MGGRQTKEEDEPWQRRRYSALICSVGGRGRARAGQTEGLLRYVLDGVLLHSREFHPRSGARARNKDVAVLASDHLGRIRPIDRFNAASCVPVSYALLMVVIDRESVT